MKPHSGWTSSTTRRGAERLLIAGEEGLIEATALRNGVWYLQPVPFGNTWPVPTLAGGQESSRAKAKVAAQEALVPFLKSAHQKAAFLKRCT
jgi:hypothetical protein